MATILASENFDIRPPVVCHNPCGNKNFQGWVQLNQLNSADPFCPRGMKMMIAGISRLDVRSDARVLPFSCSEPKIGFTAATLRFETISRIVAPGRSDPRSFLARVPLFADEFLPIAAVHSRCRCQ